MGYETNDEEKRKKKYKPASVKEPTSYIRLLHHRSTVLRDNHLIASSIQWDRSCSRQNLVLVGRESPHFSLPPCIVCKSVSSQQKLELLFFSSQCTLGLELVYRSSWLHQQDSTSRYRSVVYSVSYQQAANKHDDKFRVCCSTYLRSTPRFPSCGKDLALGSLQSHLRTQHGMDSSSSIITKPVVLAPHSYKLRFIHQSGHS